MRVLVVHNYYGSEAPSGENNAVDVEIAMLRRNGHDVESFTRRSDEIRSRKWTGLIRGGLAVAWNPFEWVRFAKMVESVKPDIVHAHNTFPLISPAIFWALKKRAPCVLTLHNYRIFCAAAMLMRRGSPCTKCLEAKSALPAIRYGCYRNSRIATLPLANSIALHQSLGTWQTKIDAFVAFTEFQRDKLVSAGLPADKLFVKPQALIGTPSVVPWERRENTALYVGRLTPEKGVADLVKAWIELGSSAPRLRIVGEGPLKNTLEKMAVSGDAKNISFHGGVSAEMAAEQIARAKLLIVPSTGFEGFPLVLLDALASGTPSAVSNLGALPTIIKDGVNGLNFETGSATDIAHVIRSIWADERRLVELSKGARSSFERQYTETINHGQLMEIYSQAAREFGGKIRQLA